MYVGRVRAAKGVFDLLEAFAVAIREGLTKTRLIFIGSGEDSEALQKAIKAGGLERQAYMLGQIDHAVLPDIMRRATVVVTPTRPELIEGRCKVVIESLALGVPVIAPDFAAFPHAIQQGSNGLLYPAGNVEALKDALKTVLEDSALLQNLKRGATSSVKTLLGGGTSFAAAVEAAFTS
jgi:glycosyltransferase involved in cell wall biosynthesis